MKRFRGWEPSTVYEHDEAGRLIRSAPEVEWDDDQRAWMRALATYRSDHCPCGCGNDVRDTTAPEGTYRWRVRKVRCLARDAIVLAQQQAEKKGQQRPEAVIWGVEKEG